jgi:6-pyruvoyltetrahydropterin/6-carboxytetrahydropterin synthase
VEVLAEGEVDAATGMVVNLATFDEVVRIRIIERFDHVNLNLDPIFTAEVPTTENLCREIFRLLTGTIEPANLAQVRVEETENNFFEYRGEQG